MRRRVFARSRDCNRSGHSQPSKIRVVLLIGAPAARVAEWKLRAPALLESVAHGATVDVDAIRSRSGVINSCGHCGARNMGNATLLLEAYCPSRRGCARRSRRRSRSPSLSTLLSALGSAIVGICVSPADALADVGGVRWDTSAEVGAYYDSDDVAVLTPALTLAAREPAGGWSAKGSYLVDIVSAASVDIVSAASPRWTEVRHAATLGAAYKPGTLGGSVTGAASVEPDYRSLGAGIAGTYDVARKNATISLGYTYEHDIAGRTGTPFSVYGLRLDRHELNASVEIVMDRATTLTPSLDVLLEYGRQEKPYRWLPLFDRSVASSVPIGASIDRVNQLRLPGRVSESLPDSRQRFAASARLAHRFEHSTLVLWDRAYLDSWGLLASTADLHWVMELSRRWSLWPHARLHTQSGVSFWRRAYVGSVASGRVVVPEYRTGDRELGPLWSATLGPGLRWDIGTLDPRSLSITFEVQETYTEFRDALYIDHRFAVFALAGLSARFQ